MQYTTDELSFAATVRSLAIKIRHDEWIQAVDKWEEGKTTEARNAVATFKASWHADHPLSGYIKTAYQRVCEAAEIISQIRLDAR